MVLTRFLLRTPFHALCLLSGGERADNTQTGWTALHAAAAAGQLECLNALLAGRATVDVKTLKGETPVALATDAPCKAALEAAWFAG